MSTVEAASRRFHFWQSCFNCGSCSRLLQQRGLRLRELEAGNHDTLDFPGLLIKHSNWRWPTRNLAGNAIDFGMKVLKRSFHDTMLEITRR